MSNPNEPMHMALCEVHSLVLRPGQLYTFSKVGDCEKCTEMHQHAEETYGELGETFEERDAKHVTTLEIERLRAQVEALTRPAVPDAKAMANRLMGWKLPKTFYPDGFISFDRAEAEACKTWPIGTNLFTVDQATEMFEYVLAAAPQPEAQPLKPLEPEFAKFVSENVFDLMGQPEAQPRRGMSALITEARQKESEYSNKVMEAVVLDVMSRPERCPYCDDTGDVHTPTGEWRGRCVCPAAQKGGA